MGPSGRTRRVGPVISAPPSAAMKLVPSHGGSHWLLLLQRQAGNRATGILVNNRPPLPLQRGLVEDMIRFDRKEKTLMRLLAGTAQGQQAVATRERYGIILSWTDSGAASFDGADRCYLNQNLDVNVIAGYFIHEMHHVERKKSGSSPDADLSPDEQEYVDRMVNEEIDGTVLGFEARISSPGSLMPGEEFYRQAYTSAKNRSLAAGEDPLAAEQKGREAGRGIVSQLIRPRDGSWPRIAPNQFESYDMFYRRIWRRSHQGTRIP